MRNLRTLGFPVMILYNMDLEAWCRCNHLEAYTVPCHVCQRSLAVNIPFASRMHRGLTAPTCICGNDEVPFTFVDLRLRNGRLVPS